MPLSVLKRERKRHTAKVENLSKEFIMHIRNDAQIEGFEGICLEVEAGTLTAVTGPSGCGKSSLLK